jgi:Uma2 family endonuclease
MNVSLVPDVRMNVAEFLAWSELHPEPEDQRYELVEGEVVAVPRAETIGHNRAKWAAYRTLHDAVRAAGLLSAALMKGVGVATDDKTVRLPDVMVQSGPITDRDAVLVEKPLIVVEVASPGNPVVSKLVDYFSAESIRHYLISVLSKSAVIHHERNEHGAIVARVVKDGDIVLDPPGLSVSVAAFLGEED